MRSVAPDSAGRAVSQNSCSVVNLKPTSFSLATTIDQTIQTEKASSRLGIEIHRLRRAIVLPELAQNPGSSGRQSVRTWRPRLREAIKALLLLPSPRTRGQAGRKPAAVEGRRAGTPSREAQAGRPGRARRRAPSGRWPGASR